MSEPVRVLIVEDEFMTIDSIKDALEEMGYIISGMARDAKEAMEVLDKEETDMIILDINIQGDKDGIWLAGEINRTYSLPFIFLTANSDEKTVKSAIETKPYGYLVKPFNKVDIYTSIEVALKNYSQIQQEKVLPLKSVKDRPLMIDDSLFVKENHLYSKIKLKEILFIKSEMKYVEIYIGAKKHTLRHNLADLIEVLPPEYFIQVHRSYIVNKNFVDNIGATFLMVKGVEIPISTSRKEEVLKEFNVL